jgi:NAD(P)-dependent dehydrogenase (short-subunit alcohol dehydrogenase family)
MDLASAVVLVTGAAGGLGRAIAGTLARSGATVILADVRAREAKRAAVEIERHGGHAGAVELDLLDGEGIEDAVRAVLAEHGHIDVLVNNAGTDVTAPAEELTIEQWDRIIGVNLRAPFIASRAVLGSMAERGRGHIVNVTSTAAKRAWPNASAYHASKWGLLGLSHALHAEARARNVKVTAVVAGGMRTPFLLDRFPELDEGLLQDPGNVAETVRFVLTQPDESVVPEVMVLPMRETSWP